MVDIEWEEHGIDCMKINISLPNLARIKVWKYAYENSYYFTTFGKNNVEEEQKQWQCAYGGPLIIFNREQLAGITILNQGKVILPKHYGIWLQQVIPQYILT